MANPRLRTAGFGFWCHLVIVFIVFGTVLTGGSTHEVAPPKRTVVDRNIGPRITDVEVDTMRIHATNGPGRETIVSVTDWSDPAKQSAKSGPNGGGKQVQQPEVGRSGMPPRFKQLVDERDVSQKKHEASETIAVLRMLKDLGFLDQDETQLQTSRRCKSCKPKDMRATEGSAKGKFRQNKSTSKNRVKRFLDLFSGSSGFQTVDVLAELQGHLSDPFSHDGGSGIGGKHGGFGGGRGYGADDDFGGGHGPYSSGHREPSINGRDHGYDPGESFIDSLSDGRDYGHGFTSHDIFRGIIDGPHGHGGHHSGHHGGGGGGGGGGDGGGNHDFGGGYGGRSPGHGGFLHGKSGGGFGASGNNIFGFAMNDYTPSGVFFGVADATNGDAVDTDILPVKVKHPRIRTAKTSPKSNLKRLLARALRALKGKTVAKSNQPNSASSTTRSQKIRLLKVVRELLRRIKARQAKGKRISGVSSRLPGVVVTESPLQDYAGSHRRKRSVDNQEFIDDTTKAQFKDETLQPQDDGYSVAYNPTSSLQDQDSTGYFYPQTSVPEQPYSVDTTQQLVPLDTNTYASAFGSAARGIPTNTLLYESPSAKGYHDGLHDTSNEGYISLANVGASQQTSAGYGHSGYGDQSYTAPDSLNSLNSNAGYELYSSPSVRTQGKSLETPNADYGIPSTPDRTSNYYDHRSTATGSEYEQPSGYYYGHYNNKNSLGGPSNTGYASSEGQQPNDFQTPSDNNLVFDLPASGNGYHTTAGNHQSREDSSYTNSPQNAFPSSVKDAGKESLREDPYAYDRTYQPEPKQAVYETNPSGGYYMGDGSYSGAVGAGGSPTPTSKSPASQHGKESYGHNIGYGHDGGYGSSGGYGKSDGYGHDGGYGHDSGYGGGGYGHSDGYGHGSGGYGHGSGGYGHGGGGYGHSGGYGKDKGKGKVKKWDKGYYGKGKGKWGQTGDHHGYHQGQKNGKWKTDLHDHYNTKGTKIKTYSYGGQGWYKENSHGQNQGYGASNGDTYGKFDGGYKGKSQEYKNPYHNYNSQSSGYQREHGYYKK